MFKRLKVKLYPTFKQREVLDRHFDAYRFCYNLCLEYKSTLWYQWKKNVSGYDMSSEIFEIRRGTEWLLKCKAECLREAGQDVDKTFKKFFKGYGYPKFKSKKGEQSFRVHQSLKCNGNKLFFYRNWINFKTSENYTTILNTNKISQVTFKRDSCGDYWASCLVKFPDVEKLDKNKNIIGIDLGLKDLVITSDGVKYENNKYLRNTYFRIRSLQRRLQKAKKGGKNREKIRINIAKLYRKATRQREWYYHNITNELIRDNQTIVLETLRIKNMAKNRKLSRSINDASWGLLVSMLEYKALWYGREIVKVDSFYPSSKICSGCGNKKNELSLSEREYICSSCGLVIDRDINAAINLRNSGIKIPVVPMEDSDNSQANEVGNHTFNK